jgi:hypothetical protein
MNTLIYYMFVFDKECITMRLAMHSFNRYFHAICRCNIGAYGHQDNRDI